MTTISKELGLMIRDDFTKDAPDLNLDCRLRDCDFETGRRLVTAELEGMGWTVLPSHHERVFILRRGEEQLTLVITGGGLDSVELALLASSGEVRFSKTDVALIKRNLTRAIGRQEKDLLRARRKNVLRELRTRRLTDVRIKAVVLGVLRERLQFTSQEECNAYQMEVRQEQLRCALKLPQVPNEVVRTVPDIRAAQANFLIAAVPARRARTEHSVVELERLATTGGGGDVGVGTLFKNAAFGVAALQRQWGEAYSAHTHAFGYSGEATRILTESLSVCDALFARVMAAVKLLTVATALPFDECPLTADDVLEIKYRYIRTPSNFDEAVAGLVVLD